MLKRLVGSTCAVVLGAGSLIAVAAAPAPALNYYVHGNVHCTMSNGAAQYQPPLRAAAAGSQTTKVVLKGSLTCDKGETGINGMTVIGGKFKAISDYFSGDCNSINPTELTMRIKWEASGGVGKVRDTNVSWAAPVASSVEPYSYDFVGGTVETLGISGSYLGATAGVSFGSDTAASAACNPRLKAGWRFPGIGPSAQPSEITFMSPPFVSSVTPESSTLGTQHAIVVVTGQDFSADDTLSFSGDGITVNSTTFASDTELDADVSIDPNALAGTRDVTVTNSTLGAGTCADCFMVAPIVTSVSPTSLGRGATNRNLTITGQGFAPGAITQFSDPGVTVNYTAYVSPTELTANVSVAGNAPLSSYTVSVTDPGQGVGSCNACFSVNPGPTVTSVSPTSRGAGATGQVIAINGTNFASTSTVAFANPAISVTSLAHVSAVLMNATINIAPGATTGAGSVTVTNPDGGSGSCGVCFTVNKGPSITDWHPTSSPPGKYIFKNRPQHHGDSRQMYNVNIEIIGTNFANNAVVTYASNDVDINSTTFVSSTKIKMNIDVDVLDYYANALPPDRAVTVTNTDGGQATCQGCVVLII